MNSGEIGSVSPASWSASATTKEGATRAIVSNWGLEGQVDRPPETDGCWSTAITNTAMFTELLLGGEVYDEDRRTEQTIRMT